MNHEINLNEWPELGEGDPLADAAIQDWLKASPLEKDWLIQGVKQGVQSIPQAPPSYRSFLSQAEELLKNSPCLKQASIPHLYIGPLWLSISLGPGALLHTYTDPAIANILVQTGKLVNEMAAKRLSETQLWLLKLLQEDAWEPGGYGYVHTLQVRLIHAKVRASIKKDAPHFSNKQPFDQRQMVRTWLDFAIVSPQALERLGIEWTEEEQHHVAALWHLVGQLLGIPVRMMSELAQPGRALAWLKKFDQDMPNPSEKSKVLTLSMLEAMGQRMSLAMNLPKDIATSLMHGFARHIHGDALADAVGASDTSLSSLIPTYVNANRYHMRRIREDFHYKQTVIEQSAKQIQSICAQIDGSAAYQQN